MDKVEVFTTDATQRRVDAHPPGHPLAVVRQGLSSSRSSTSIWLMPNGSFRPEESGKVRKTRHWTCPFLFHRTTGLVVPWIHWKQW